ncbi:hypothetical protein Taro_004518 [Colocasia esculenta]|uniref:FHA domain-containing protein n=1 Tax=Colocasia esculenta TaxID=4460 RepID=A0A843TML8_COLES|nr:hypothetical protein [Colocasia esculenta]
MRTRETPSRWPDETSCSAARHRCASKTPTPPPSSVTTTQARKVKWRWFGGSSLSNCDVIIQTDRAVSRVHAEIIVDVMAPRSSSRNRSSNDLPNVRIRDLSKFGTFINKDSGSQAVNTFPNKKAVLKDGDLISFGTGIATFRCTSYSSLEL